MIVETQNQRRKEPILVNVPFPIAPAKARELAYEIHRIAPIKLRCTLIDDANNIIVTCIDGLVFHAMIIEGQAHVCAAEGLLEIHGSYSGIGGRV